MNVVQFTDPAADWIYPCPRPQWRSTRHLRGILETNGLGWVLAICGGLVVAGGMAAWIVEPGIDSLADGLWWSVVTATTVGYGDISPQSGLGRLVAAALMIVRIGAIGLLTAVRSTRTWRSKARASSS